MDLSIVIVNWNTRDYLKTCLESVAATVGRISHDVWVVDNASQDHSDELVREGFPSVRFVQNLENVGFARACNQGIHASQGEFILLLNSDAVLTGDTLHQMLNVLRSNPQVGIAGAALIYPDGRPQESFGPLPTLGGEILSLTGLDKLFISKNHAPEPSALALPVETGLVSGACLLARRKMLDEIGLLDEAFFMFNEEIDLCFRARKVGWKVLHLPSTRVIHVRGGSTGLTPQRILLLYKGKRQYIFKHWGGAARAVLFAVMLVTTASKALAYFCLCLFRVDKVRKDDLWSAVMRGLFSQPV